MDVIQETVCHAAVEERLEVRMLQPGRDLDLGEEAIDAKGRGELRPQHFERHAAIMAHVAGEIDVGHPARAHLALEDVPVGQTCLESSEGWEREHPKGVPRRSM